MKLITLLSVVTLFNLSASVYSQKTKFTFDSKGKTVREVFQVLEQQSKFRFFYNDEFSYIDKETNLNVKNENIEEILEKLFVSSDITYKIFNNNLIVLTLKQNIQQVMVTGVVKDANTDEALPGVGITVKGTTRRTVSDGSGVFSIEVNTNEVLVFSYMGYAELEVAYTDQSQLEIKLVPEIKGLDEIVVIGYGIQKKSSVTGSISPISSEDINELPVASIESALQGRASGISVVNNGGPGNDPIVRIRGNGSISYNATPLYVVDGFPTSEIVNFNANDIESIEILKDASATAIYGSRGANGVVLITTKKGQKDGQVHVNFDTYSGVQSLPKRLELLNTGQYVQYANTLTSSTADGKLPARLEPDNFNQPIYEGATQTFAQTETDWQDELFRNALISESNVSFSVNNANSTFFGSTGYFKQDGIMIGTGYERISFRLNSEHNLGKRIRIGQTISYSSGNREDEKRTQGRSNIMHMIRSVPYLPVHDPTKVGGYIAADNNDGTDPDNPVKVEELFDANTLTSKLFGTLYLELKLADFLTFKTTAGLDQAGILNKSYEPIYNDGFNSNGSSTVRRQQTENMSKLFTNQLTFDKDFGKHNLNIIAVAEQQTFNLNQMYISGNLTTNVVSELTGLSNITANGKKEESVLLSYLGRLNYNYDNKYLLSVAMRADGSSKFSPENKWGYFPSASIGWRVDQEQFMKDNNLFSQLKLRAGFGTTGNNAIGSYDWQSVILNNTQYVLNNAAVDGFYLNSIPNEDLKWETSKMTNVGVDLGLFDNKITFTAEYFTKITDNLILDVPMAPSMGITAPYYANIGSMKNNGVDVELGYHMNKGQFKSSISANVSVVRNEVVKLVTTTSTIDRGQHPDYGGYDITRTMEGEPIQTFYGWEVDGIIQNITELNTLNDLTADPTVFYQSSQTAPGDIKFKDLSGPDGTPDGIINDYDRTFIGSYLPKFSYGLNYSGSYKNFDFSLFIQGTYGNKIYNGTKVISQGMVRLFNSSTDVLDAWTTINTDTDVPRAIAGDPNGNTRTSDRFIEDGSYLRLKSLSIGYTLPTKVYDLTNGALSSVRIYVSCLNLLTLTKYTGYDPEVGAQIPITNGIASTNDPAFLLRSGIDYGFIPSARSIMGGISINF